MSSKLGVCLIGSNGAVSTTIMAGVALMKKNLVPRKVMITEGYLDKILGLASIDDLVFGGWDLREDSAYDATISHEVINMSLIEKVKEDLIDVYPWPAVSSDQFLSKSSGTNTIKVNSMNDEVEEIKKNIFDWKIKHKLERLVMVNLTSTERYCEIEEVHKTIESFEEGLSQNNPKISPAMKYLYVACKLGIPYVNFTPSLSKIPALEKLAEKSGIPIAGEDGKTGQTLIKTAIAPTLAVRNLTVEGWYSINILGNNDGLILKDPASNKTKVTSKKNVLDSILGYKVDDHQVHIHYYKPRGDAKEAWDNIDISGFLGEKMQLKINFLCKDSILAAPLVIDLIRLIDCASRCGEFGIQKQFSTFFKAPFYTEKEEPEHDLFKQHNMLIKWAENIKAKSHSSVKAYTPLLDKKEREHFI